MRDTTKISQNFSLGGGRKQALILHFIENQSILSILNYVGFCHIFRCSSCYTAEWGGLIEPGDFSGSHSFCFFLYILT